MVFVVNILKQHINVFRAFINIFHILGENSLDLNEVLKLCNLITEDVDNFLFFKFELL